MNEAVEDRRMTERCCELVVEGHVDLIKGFIVGFLKGKGMRGGALFARDHHVRDDTELRHFFRLLTGHEDQVHVLVDESLCQPLEDAFANVHEALPLELVSAREVAGARFSFAYEAYAKEAGDELKGLFTNLPEGVSIVGYEVKEEVDPGAKGIEAYAPLHHYQIKATGRITGAVKAVIDFYDRLDQHALVAPEEIVLEFR